MKSSLIDAGPIIALFDRSNQHHDRVIEFLKTYHGRLITTWPILTEVSYMLDFHHNTRLDFLDWVGEGGIELYNLDQWQLMSVRNLIDKNSDLPADFADATLIEAADTQNLDYIITLDSDFETYKLKSGKHLQNLLQ